MQQFKVYSNIGKSHWTDRLIGSLVLMLILFLFFYLGFYIYKFLLYISPLFILLALFFSPKVISQYLKSILVQFKISPIFGFFNLIFQALAFPFVAISLAVKAWFAQKVKRRMGTYDQYQEQEQTQIHQDSDFAEFEEIKEEEPVKRTNSDTRYDDLFE